jgi:hypothetical protein
METASAGKRGDYCHRCLELAPPKAARCPALRPNRSINKSSNLRRILAFFGLFMFLVVAAAAFRMMQTAGPGSAAATEQQTQRPGGSDTPPPPEKQPALGQ